MKYKLEFLLTNHKMGNKKEPRRYKMRIIFKVMNRKKNEK